MQGGIDYSAYMPPRAENAKINVTDEPYFGTQIVCNYLPFSKAAKGAQGGPQQYATFERKHSPTEKWKCKQAVERGDKNAIHVILYIYL